MPGGQYTNLREQAESMGLGPRWHEVARAYADVNMMFGDIVKVTPSSKVVGDMALFLVSRGMTAREFANLPEDHNLTLPNSVVDMFQGSLGEPEGGWPRRIQRIILRGGKPRRGRPGAHLKPVDLKEAQAALDKKLGSHASRTDLLSYLMYPEVFLKFARNRQAYGDLEILPTPQFFFGMNRGEEISVDLEPGKTLIVKFLTVSEPHAGGTRTVFFELNGQPREVTVPDRSLQTSAAVRVKADPSIPGHVGAPIPGAVTNIAVERNETVAKGQRLLVMEAMKMQTTVYAPIAGRIKELPVKVGETVEAKDLLLVIE
jgi:pyruvate carboxylase